MPLIALTPNCLLVAPPYAVSYLYIGPEPIHFINAKGCIVVAMVDDSFDNVGWLASLDVKYILPPVRPPTMPES